MEQSEFPVLSYKQNLACIQLGAPPNSLFKVPGLLTVSEAQACIHWAESMGFTRQGSRGPAYGEAFRDNDRFSAQDQAIADMLWNNTALSKLFKGITVEGQTAVGCNPNIRVYRYVPGNRFGKHIDDSVELEGGRRTWYTVLVYLSGPLEGTKPTPAAANTADSTTPPSTKRSKRAHAHKAQPEHITVPSAAAPCQDAVQCLVGGETVFYDDKGRLLASVQPIPGLALLHLHGEDRCKEHEALIVKQGTKYVLRTDVVFQ